MLYNNSIKLNTNHINILFDHQHNNNIIAKGGSAASKHYWKESGSNTLLHICPYSGPSLILPDTYKIAPSNKGLLSLSTQLTDKAQTSTTIPQLKSSSLISLGKIYDDACTIILNKKKLVAVKYVNIDYKHDPKEIIFEGTRNEIDSLWDISITKQNITPNNYVSPPLHGLSVPTSQSPIHLVPKHTRKNKRLVEVPLHRFEGLEDLIQNNICNYLID